MLSNNRYKPTQRGTLAILAAMATMAIAAPAFADGDTLDIGFAAALSGYLAPFDQPTLNGAQLAVVSIKFLPESLAYAVPLAGAASLSSQIFSARRYLVTGQNIKSYNDLLALTEKIIDMRRKERGQKK